VKILKRIAIPAGVITITLWGGYKYLIYSHEQESVKRLHNGLTYRRLKAESISCTSDEVFDINVDCTFKIDREQFFNSLKQFDLEYIKVNVSSADLEELEFKDLKTNKGQSGRELGYRINSSLGSNKFCEDLLISKTSSKIDLYIFIVDRQYDSEIYYVSQTETGCATIVYPVSFG
jgi:hypothetical protein